MQFLQPMHISGSTVASKRLGAVLASVPGGETANMISTTYHAARYELANPIGYHLSQSLSRKQIAAPNAIQEGIVNLLRKGR
jgi:hypothetical protein